jgi:DNA polymerase-3 subunit gamma/tau
MALNCRTEVGTPSPPHAEPCGVCDSCIEIRQGNAVDVIEIDAATNRGIDEIRELRDAARYAPSRDRYKIYILDEAHQITEAAFNALLKTLEEPPGARHLHDGHHAAGGHSPDHPLPLPALQLSRRQIRRHSGPVEDDRRPGEVDRRGRALALLAEAGDGSMRDALSIMDQAIASAPVEAGRPCSPPRRFAS